MPDPTVGPIGGPRWRAYVVLDSQLSYTDAAIRAGWGKAATGQYRSVFRDEERAARDAGVGLWGPCGK